MMDAVPSVTVQEAIDDVLCVRVLSMGGYNGRKFRTCGITHESFQLYFVGQPFRRRAAQASSPRRIFNPPRRSVDVDAGRDSHVRRNYLGSRPRPPE
jgi:hypothetical protein